MKKYCPSCGKPNPATAKFCCNCASSMSLQLSDFKREKKALSKSNVTVEEYEEEDEEFINNATQLDVEIDYSNPMPKETFGQVMGTGGPVTTDGAESGGGGPTVSEEEFLKEFQREAGPLRKGPSVGEN